MKIGVLDDNPTLCRTLETALALAGHDVYAYTDPPIFVASAYPDQIDYFKCIIVDFHLTGNGSGADVIRRIREMYPLLPAVLISGDVLPQATLRRFSNGQFCQKPFRISTLLQAIDRLYLRA